MSEFSIRAVANGPQCDLILSGEVDLAVVQALTRVARYHLADSDVQRLLFDLGALSFLDCTGMGALVAIRNAAKQQGKTIELANIPQHIRRLPLIVGLGGVFAICSSDASGANLSGPQSAADSSERDAPTDPQLRTVPS